MNAHTLDKAVILSHLIVWVIFIAGMIRVAVPNRILRLYPFRVRMLTILPFSTRWQREIAPEHLEAYGKARRWIFGGSAAILAVGLLQFAYFHFFFMKVHGLDMKNVSLHVEYTDLRPSNDADTARAAALVTDLQHALGKYQDYHVAEADGFQPFQPDFKVPVVGFWKHSNDSKGAFTISDPTSLLYQPTADGGYKLVGATYIDQQDTTEDQLDQHVPLSVARWHRDVNLCLPPRGTDPKKVDWTKFGSNGSIATEQACDAASGRFFPQFSGWMFQVHPWAQNPELVWAQ